MGFSGNAKNGGITGFSLIFSRSWPRPERRFGLVERLVVDVVQLVIFQVQLAVSLQAVFAQKEVSDLKPFSTKSSTCV